MSKRRKPGEVVKRRPGSGFCGAEEPQLVKVPEGKTYEADCVLDATGKWTANPGGESSTCMMGCGDSACREWANLEVVSGDFAGQTMYHISECQMEDA